jgi:excisionase family DNA binding protein
MKTSTEARNTQGRADTEQERPALDCKARPIRLTYTVDEARRLLGIGRSFAYSLCKSGEMPGLRVLGKRYVISRQALDEFLAHDEGSVKITRVA